MTEQGLRQTDAKFAFVTCGDWDLKTMSVYTRLYRYIIYTYTS